MPSVTHTDLWGISLKHVQHDTHGHRVCTHKQKALTGRVWCLTGWRRIMSPAWWWWCQRAWTSLSFSGLPDGVRRTALLESFRLLGQIQLLLPLYTLKKTNTFCLCFMTFSWNLIRNGWWHSAKPWEKLPVFCVDGQTGNDHSCKAKWGDWISFFWNHLQKCRLATNRKCSHSLWVYYRSQRSHSTEAQTPWAGLDLSNSNTEEMKCTSSGVWSISLGFNEASHFKHLR